MLELQHKHAEQSDELQDVRDKCHAAQAEVGSKGTELNSCMALLHSAQDRFQRLSTQHGQVQDQLEDLTAQRDKVSS